MSTTIQTCEVCKLSHQPPTKYLLVCSQCSTGYHHRCCNPPMNDAQLASLVRASKKNKPGKGLAAWKCGPCVKGKGKDAVGEQPTRSSAAGKEKLIIELLDDEVDAPVTVTATSTRTEHFVEIQNSTASQDLAISNPDSNDQAGNNETTHSQSTTSDVAWWRIPGGKPPPKPPAALAPDPSTPSSPEATNLRDPRSLNHHTSPTRASRARTLSHHYDRHQRNDSRNIIIPETPQATPSSSLQSNRSQFAQPMSLPRREHTGHYGLHGPRGHSPTARNMRGHRNHTRRPDASIDNVSSMQSANATFGSSQHHSLPERPTQSTDAAQEERNYEEPDFRAIARKVHAEGRVFDPTIPELMGQLENLGSVHSIGQDPGGRNSGGDAERSLPTPMSLSPAPAASVLRDDEELEYVDWEPPQPHPLARLESPQIRANRRPSRPTTVEDLLDLSALRLTEAEKSNHTWLFNKPITQYYPRVQHASPHRLTTPRNENSMEMDVDVDLRQVPAPRCSRKPTTTTHELSLRKHNFSVRQRGLVMVASEGWAERIEKGKEIMERSRESSSLRDGDSESESESGNMGLADLSIEY